MDIYVSDENMQNTRIIDYAQSVIWHKAYCGAGDFELYVPNNEKLKDFIADNAFVYRKESDTVMIIEKIQTDENLENGDYLIISGRSAESMIGRRIVWEQTNLNGTVTDCVKQLLEENVISPSNPARKISFIKSCTGATISQTITKQLTGDNLLEAIPEILQTYGLGYELTPTFEKSGGYFDFRILKGADRSEGNSEGNPTVKFSADFDNLIASSYSVDYTEYKNVALVAGEGEGTARRTKEVGDAAGLNRREVYTDSRNTSSNDGAVSVTDYDAMLEESGKGALAEAKAVENFTGEIIPDSSYILNQDYFIGDIVTLENKYGIKANVRITDITENYDENGMNTVLSYQNI